MGAKEIENPSQAPFRPQESRHRGGSCQRPQTIKTRSILGLNQSEDLHLRGKARIVVIQVSAQNDWFLGRDDRAGEMSGTLCEPLSCG